MISPHNLSFELSSFMVSDFDETLSLLKDRWICDGCGFWRQFDVEYACSVG